MNILVVSHEYPPVGGGGANACFYLTKEYAKAGHQVTVVTSSYRDLPCEENNNNVAIIRVRALRKREEKSTFAEMLSFLYSAGKRTARLARTQRFDVCQIFFGIPSGPIGLCLRKKHHIPYIIRFGGGDIPGAQKRFRWIYKLLNPFIHMIWGNADALVANSEELRKKALKFDDRYPIETIPNGVDSSFFTVKGEREVCGEKNEKINILFVSRLIRGKGLQYILPEMERIKRESGREVGLTIVGDGPFRGELEEIAQREKVCGAVSFEGKKNRQELCRYYSSADLFILPSESEGMPNVVLEAMAMGLPVIMTPCGGSEELIQGNGSVVPIEQFADAIINLCRDEQARVRMGKQSERLAREKFGWQDKAEQYLEIFERCRK